MLITINFGIQLMVDLLSAGFVDRIGYRASIVIAHLFAAAGLGGLIEVLISPIMESCTTENKEKAMSLLHAFYCWGHQRLQAIWPVP